MSNLKNLSASLISAMRERKMLRTDGFSLHADFVGQYTVVKVEVTASKVGSDVDNFRLHCQSSTGSHSIPGFMMVNAFMVPKDVVLPATPVREDRPSCLYYEAASDVIRQSTRLHGQFDESGFQFPDTFEVLGAMIPKDSVGDHPYVPLRRYPFYSTLLSYHKKLNPEATYLDRDTIAMYLADQGPDRVSVPKDFKFQLKDHATAVWEFRNWNPTLFIRDWR